MQRVKDSPDFFEKTLHGPKDVEKSRLAQDKSQAMGKRVTFQRASQVLDLKRQMIRLGRVLILRGALL